MELISGTTTAGVRICPKCFQHYPAAYSHLCPTYPPGPADWQLRSFSEWEIRQIVRDEIKRASSNGTGG